MSNGELAENLTHNTPGKNGVKALPAEFYTRFISDVAKSRKPSAIRSLFPLEKIPGLISLLAGNPNPSLFPFTSLNFTARSPSDENSEVSLSLTEEELARGLQYGATAGFEPLCDWIRGLQEYSHGRKSSEGWGLSIGSGSQDLLYKAIAALVNPGDSVLVESPVYAGVLPMFDSLNCEQIEVDTDAHGISSSSLRSILENWPAAKPKPRILYTVPYGCNPTGMTASLERRKEVLALAREHDFLILEDDPYFYLYYGKAPRYPSYFSLELEEPETGRVLRFDSLSKILSAGIRIGFATGPTQLLQAINQHASSCKFIFNFNEIDFIFSVQTATSNLQTSTLTQVIVWKLLVSWGYDGFKEHTEKVSDFYRSRRDVFQQAMEKHLSGLAAWTIPEAGMFFWFKLLLDDDPSVEGDSHAVISVKAVERGVLALPGTVFLPNGRKTGYVRASFSLLDDAAIDESLNRLGKVVQDARAS